MQYVRSAVIDIGTNSVKLLVADVAGTRVEPLWEESKQTRLGSGFYTTRRLQPESIAGTAAAVGKFAEMAREWNPKFIRVIATSAARDAVNPGDLVAAVQSASGLQTEIISGDQEADWVFRGVTTDPRFARAPLLLLDVGGGSTEFIVGQGEHKHFQASFPLGTVRLLEQLPHGDPPREEDLAACRQAVRDFLAEHVCQALRPALSWELKLHGTQAGVGLVATGGTATILARIEARLETFDRMRIEGMALTRERVRWQVNHLWSRPLAARQEIPGLPRNRADVILPGAAICEAVMDVFRFPELRVSTRGLRFAAVMAGA